MLDLINRNGTIATSEPFRADIGVKASKISALGLDLGSAHDVIEAAGNFVLPGEIDSHVHIAQPSGSGLKTADDFDTAILSALFGGSGPSLFVEAATDFQDVRTRPIGGIVHVR